MVESGTMASINMQLFLHIYIVVAMAIFSAVAAYVLFIERELWKQITVLTIAMLILPQFSADYRLIYIFIPLLIYINIDKRPHLDIAYLIVFGLLLIPKSYFFLTKIVSNFGNKRYIHCCDTLTRFS